MSNKKEVADIREEWQFTLRNSDLSHSIPVHGGWLTAAMSQIWDYINDLETDIVDLLNDVNTHVKETLDLEETVATLKLEAEQKDETKTQ